MERFLNHSTNFNIFLYIGAIHACERFVKFLFGLNAKDFQLSPKLFDKVQYDVALITATVQFDLYDISAQIREKINEQNAKRRKLDTSENQILQMV